MKRIIIIAMVMAVTATVMAQQVRIDVAKGASERELYAKEYLTKKLTAKGYEIVTQKGDMRILPPEGRSVARIALTCRNKGTAEGYMLLHDRSGYNVVGNDPSGVIYGAVELMERLADGRLEVEGHNTEVKRGRVESGLAAPIASEVPQMVMRGTCIGLQKTVYLPGHAVYEYPYTPENFPWFYDKEEWVKYLDMMVENKMNSLYLWNGHPFASLVKLKDYPFALEVDEETFKKNEEIFSFLTHEADKRGIWVIQMFYNIILSKPFADHYGLKTQDRNRPITPLIADYTRKSIAAFIEKYPHVGLLVCLGEAMATIEDDVTWMKETIIPGIKDGLSASGRTDIPPVVLRSHDTDGPLVLRESLPLYPNIYTMSKYTQSCYVRMIRTDHWSFARVCPSIRISTRCQNIRGSR